MQQLISRLSVPIKILIIISIKANKKIIGEMFFFFPPLICFSLMHGTWTAYKIKILRGGINKHCHGLLFNSPGHDLILNWDKHWPCPREMESGCETERKKERDIRNMIEGWGLMNRFNVSAIETPCCIKHTLN